jgi:hypothetical protein
MNVVRWIVHGVLAATGLVVVMLLAVLTHIVAVSPAPSCSLPC